MCLSCDWCCHCCCRAPAAWAGMGPSFTAIYTHVMFGPLACSPARLPTQGLLFVRPKPVTPGDAASRPDESTIPIVDEFEDPEWVTQVSDGA